MISFSEVTLPDKNWIDPLIKAGDGVSCAQSFSNLFLWKEAYAQTVAQVDNYLVVRVGKYGDDVAYGYPIGTGDITPVIESMMADAEQNGLPFMLVGVQPHQQAELETLFHGKFEITPDRDSWDYVYDIEKLISLSGKKLHGKRNHIARFKDEDNWSFEEMTPENIPDCQKMNREWCRRNGCSDDPSLGKEAAAVQTAFENFSALGLEGGVLRRDGEVIAFTMGCKLCCDTFVTHIEKAFGEIQGCYPMINQQFAIQIKEKHPEVAFVNREEDMGEEGLRRAKLSYQPAKMVEKHIARLITTEGHQ